MKKWHIVLIALGVFTLPLIFGLYEIGLFKTLEPLREDVRRDIFENTKSYLHGVQQDLGKYYNEYQSAAEDDKTAIRATIQMRFAEVDESKIQNPRVREFLVQMRGY